MGIMRQIARLPWENEYHLGGVGVRRTGQRPKTKKDREDAARSVDTGCVLHPSCLSCPLPKCVHDMTQREQRELRGFSANYTEIRRRYRAGETINQLVLLFDVSRRSVYRITQGIKRQGVVSIGETNALL